MLNSARTCFLIGIIQANEEEGKEERDQPIPFPTDSFLNVLGGGRAAQKAAVEVGEPGEFFVFCSTNMVHTA